MHARAMEIKLMLELTSTQERTEQEYKGREKYASLLLLLVIAFMQISRSKILTRELMKMLWSGKWLSDIIFRSSQAAILDSGWTSFATLAQNMDFLKW